ncbi:MAG TPA: LysE family transporter [Prolixibacteraceae bacterium]|nr:LysE family transporter [Prolixibacteraceae bacterium]HPS12782.1 LysE family transporter [Prolixibacteraceae bacterium]
MGFFISVPIGPMGILVIQRTVNRNLKSGIFTGLGIASTDAIWILVAGFSVSYIVTFIETYQSYIQIVGAVILFLLGLNIFMSHPIKAMKETKRKGSSPFQCYITAMALSFSNPLVILAYIALLASTKIVFNINDMIEPAIFVSAFFLGGLCWWLTLAFSINLFRHRFNLRVLWWFNKISGALIMFFIIVSTIYVLIKGNPIL